MKRQRKISCAEYLDWKQDLEARGYRVLACTPVGGERDYCWLTFEEGRPNLRPRAVRSLRGVSGVRAKIEMSRSRKIARRLFDMETPPSRLQPRRIAQAVLRRLAPTLGIRRDLSDLKFERVKQTIFGSHAFFQQYIGATPISGAWIRVDMDRDGRVFGVQNDLVPQPALEKGRSLGKAKGRSTERAKLLTETEARARALAAVSVSPKGKAEVLSLELTYRLVDDAARLSWKAIVRTTRPPAEWKMYLDASSGAVLWKRNVLKRVTGSGRVFDPNPVVALNDTALSDRSRIPETAYRSVELPDLAATGYLDGPYVSTADTRNRKKHRNRRFLFLRGNPAFKEVMVYFHIDRVQRHLQSLGFHNLLARPIKVDVAGERDDNSSYSPATKSLSFGTGGVDDAEDAEIILHEYGHAIQDDQVAGWGETDEGAAMGEGFGDFLAASFFADIKPGPLRPTMGNWDAVAYSADDPPCLRRLDSNKRYPKDITGEEHDDGEIWSACLWQLRTRLGREVTERLVIAHHQLLNRWAVFEDAANALLTADRQLNGGRNVAVIRDLFVRRGIFRNPRRKNRRAGSRFDE